MSGNDGPVTGFRRYNDQEGKCRGCDKIYRYHDLDAIDEYETHFESKKHKMPVWVLSDGNMCTTAEEMHAYIGLNQEVQQTNRNRETRYLKHDPPPQGAKNLVIEKPKFGQMRAAVRARPKDSAGSASHPNQSAHPHAGGGSSSVHHTAERPTTGMHNFTVGPATGGDFTHYQQHAQHHMPGAHPAGPEHHVAGVSAERGSGHSAAGAEAIRHYTADPRNLRCHNCARNWPWAQEDCVWAYKDHWEKHHEAPVKVCKGCNHMSLTKELMGVHTTQMRELGYMEGHTAYKDEYLPSMVTVKAPDDSQEIYQRFTSVPDWNYLLELAERMRNANANRHH